MMKIAMSRAAAGLMRALLDRAGADRNRILLTDFRSTDWQSLTLVGERHCIQLRICGDDRAAVAERITHGLEDAEFAIPRQIVADIGVVDEACDDDGEGVSIVIEALTVAE